ncbi:hypothetical protein [Frankia sp. AgKG'84/4]|uniref:hypothetical protein n=1 Tax=Frankia sp. AgKG'84/4 TaxID=573490 RepID=UPI00200C16AC|nr:hypothetical protein [Frankia sp. AgKG'84/4]MCL9793810.1 hypothetical protein [Frankia sp. AgKG'84/4]
MTVLPGGALSVTGGQISGAVASSQAAAITLRQSSVNGAVAVLGTTGYALIGSDHLPCAGNTLTGALDVSRGTGGVQITGNTVTGARLGQCR